MSSRFFTWTVELKVDRSWVADGFNLTAERAKEMLARELRGAYNSELRAKILSAPDEDQIARAQGYKGAADPRYSP